MLSFACDCSSKEQGTKTSMALTATDMASDLPRSPTDGMMNLNIDSDDEEIRSEDEEEEIVSIDEEDLLMELDRQEPAFQVGQNPGRFSCWLIGD